MLNEFSFATVRRLPFNDGHENKKVDRPRAEARGEYVIVRPAAELGTTSGAGRLWQSAVPVDVDVPDPHGSTCPHVAYRVDFLVLFGGAVVVRRESRTVDVPERGVRQGMVIAA